MSAPKKFSVNYIQLERKEGLLNKEVRLLCTDKQGDRLCGIQVDKGEI